MNELEEQTQIHVRLPAHLVSGLDRLQKRVGFSNRADMLKGFILLLLRQFEREEDSLLFQAADTFLDKKPGTPALSEQQISWQLQDIIGSMLMPVIAAKGARAACKAALCDIQDAFFEKTGIWLSEDEIREGFYEYELMNKPALRNYLMSINKHKECDNNDNCNTFDGKDE